MDTITLKMKWNQWIIEALCTYIKTGTHIPLCGDNDHVQDMKYIVSGFYARRPATILCNKCEMMREMIEDRAYFIV